MAAPNEFHVHVHQDDKLEKVLCSLYSLHQKVDRLMALSEELKAGIKKVADATTKVANRLTELTQQLRDSSLTTTERNEVLGQIDELATHLEEMGTDPANPVPPEPPALTTKKTPKKK